MGLEILSKEQFELISILFQFTRDYYLVYGTAVVLHVGLSEFTSFTYDSKNNKLKML